MVSICLTSRLYFSSKPFDVLILSARSRNEGKQQTNIALLAPRARLALCAIIMFQCERMQKGMVSILRKVSVDCEQASEKQDKETRQQAAAASLALLTAASRTRPHTLPLQVPAFFTT